MAGRTHAVVARPNRPLRLVLVGPESLIGLGIRRALEQEAGFQVVGDAETTDGALPLLGDAHPDVIVVDLRLLDTSTVDATRRLRAGAEDAAIVVVGGDANAGSMLGAIELGATAHVTEGADASELASAIERAAIGDDQLKEELRSRPELVERIVDAMRAGPIRADDRDIPLTARELEILAAAARGMRNREIADAMGIGEQTVKNHMSSVLLRLGVRNRTLAVAHAVRRGWIDPGDVSPPVPRRRSRRGSRQA